MRPVKNFDEFIKEGIARKITPDKERAKSLSYESERKIRSLNEQIEKIGIKDENANDYVEYCYNIFMYLIRAHMLLKGFNASGSGAHEAEVSYMRVLGFEEKDVQFADQIRFFRNGMLYYGKLLDKEYGEKVIEFTKRVYQRLKEKII
jgi:hypothetical protein